MEGISLSCSDIPDLVVPWESFAANKESTEPMVPIG